MNSRKVNDHARLVEQIKKLSDAIQNPTEKSFAVLMEAASYIERETVYPSFYKVTGFPDIEKEYLEKMAAVSEFNVKRFFSHLDGYKDPRSTAKNIYTVTTDPYALISKMTRCQMIPKESLRKETKKNWMKIFSMDIKQKMIAIKKELKKVSTNDIVKGVGIAARYTGVIVIIIGTLLMSYLICMVGLGLLVVDVTINNSFKEAIDPSEDVASDTKNFPYVLSGSFPLVHVNRSEEYITTQIDNNNAFAANNMLTLVKSITNYENYALGKARGYKYWGDSFPFRELGYQVDSWTGFTETSVYEFKTVIMDVSNKCLDHSFNIPEEDRGSWCDCFRNMIKNFCSYVNGYVKGAMVDIGSLVSMYELVCLQIWDGFLRDNAITKKQKIENRYLHVDVTDDSHAIQQMYNMMQLHPTRTTNNATQLANKILESVGSSYNQLMEATINNNQNTEKEIQGISARFTRAMATSKQAAAQISQRALPWCANNTQKLKDAANNFTSQDSATIKDYTYNVKNIQTASEFLAKVNNYITNVYPKNRTQSPTGNINELIKQSFPSLQLGNTAYPANQVANAIMTGSPEKDPKETTVTGSQLKEKYNQMLDVLTNQATKQYFSSNIFDQLTNIAKNYQTTINNAAKQPTNPAPAKQESILYEADNNSAPPTMATQQAPTMSNQGSPNNTAGQNAQANQPKAPEKKETIQANTNNANDAHVFEHAANVTVAVMTAVQSMVNEAYNLVIQYYSDLINRNQQDDQQTQQTQQQ